MTNDKKQSQEQADKTTPQEISGSAKPKHSPQDVLTDPISAIHPADEKPVVINVPSESTSSTPIPPKINRSTRHKKQTQPEQLHPIQESVPPQAQVALPGVEKPVVISDNPSLSVLDNQDTSSNQQHEARSRRPVWIFNTVADLLTFTMGTLGVVVAIFFGALSCWQNAHPYHYADAVLNQPPPHVLRCFYFIRREAYSFRGKGGAPITLSDEHLSRDAKRHAIVLHIANLGSEPISPSDFVKPISFLFPINTHIVAARVDASQPSDLGAEIKVDNRKIILTPLLLNPNDSADIVADVKGAPGPVSISARVRNISELWLYGPLYSLTGQNPENNTVIPLVEYRDSHVMAIGDLTTGKIIWDRTKHQINFVHGGNSFNGSPSTIDVVKDFAENWALGIIILSILLLVLDLFVRRRMPLSDLSRFGRVYLIFGSVALTLMLVFSS